MAKVTLQDVADAVGVSRMTVSNAFNRPDKLSESLRATILETATGLGYGGPDPSARALARGRSGTVGLLLTDTLGEAFRDPVSTEFLVAVGDALAERSLALTLVATAGDKPPLGQDLPMDGAIVYVCDPRVDLDWLQRRGTPVVTVDQSPTKGVPAVNVDDVGGARAGAEHLLEPRPPEDRRHHRRAGPRRPDPSRPGSGGTDGARPSPPPGSSPSSPTPALVRTPPRTTRRRSCSTARTARPPCSASPTSTPRTPSGPPRTSACASPRTCPSSATTTPTSPRPSGPRSPRSARTSARRAAPPSPH